MSPEVSLLAIPWRDRRLEVFVQIPVNERVPGLAQTTTSEAPERSDVTSLVKRFRGGDSEAVGEFVSRYGPIIRSHFRRKIGASMHRLVDSQDLLSTISRRLCQRVQNGRVRAEDDQQLWALVYRIGNDALIDRVKIVSRLRSLESEGSPFVRGMRDRLDQGGVDSPQEFAEELHRMLGLLSTSADRELLVQWLHGKSLADAGASLGMNAAMARKRWQRIRETLQDALAE
ncbi:MAG: ECF-type sigma factor [Phycisphaerales bacterium JB041]